MKVAHWVKTNNSGMNRLATGISKAEVALGIESVIVDSDTFQGPLEADIHVCHTHVNEDALYSGKPIVWVAHGTPEVMFRDGFQQGTVNGAYGHSDAWMLAQFWLKRADAIVTFWERHAVLWESLAGRKAVIDLLPAGIDTAFWSAPADSAGKYVGSPSVFTAENCYEIKWPLDLFLAWPMVVSDPRLHKARLHAIYLPKDQHRWWFPLLNANGAGFFGYYGAHVFDEAQLRNAFRSTDYYVSLVRYGDASLTSMEAAAAGAKVISYAGNPYATFWIEEGDQRTIARRLIEVLSEEYMNDQVFPFRQTPARVPDISDTARGMVKVYEGLL